MQHPNDSSIEEILESIKKVIARDNRETAIMERKLRETRGVVEPRSVAEHSVPTQISDETSADGGILDLGAGAGAFFDSSQAETAEEEHDPLTSADAQESMRQSFAALSMLAQSSKEENDSQPSESTLESMVREMMRPMLADWLDQNLPAIVEGLVRDEINQIAGKRR